MRYFSRSVRWFNALTKLRT